MNYRVSTDDNFHYADASERDDGITYKTAEEALSAARLIVDKSLRHLYEVGFTPEKLYDYYQDFGDDPFIITDDESCKFSAWQYAETRCPSICEEQQKEAK